MTTRRKGNTPAECAWIIFECCKPVTVYWISNSCFPEVIRNTQRQPSSSNAHYCLCQFVNSTLLVTIQINEVGKQSGIVKWHKCQCSFSIKAASLVLDVSLFKTPDRLNTSRSIHGYSRWKPQQNANGRHNALCRQDFNTGIVNSQKERRLDDQARPRDKKKTPISSISVSVWPHFSRLDERLCLCGKVKQYSSRSAGLGQTLQPDLTALRWNIHEVASMEAQRQRPSSDPWVEPPAWTGPPAAP